MPKKAERYTSDILSRPGMVFAVDLKHPKERVQAYLDSYKNDPETTAFDASLMKHHLKLLAATAPPKVTATFTMNVTRDFCSTMGNMHGGAIALVLDMCTTACMAPVSTPDFWLFGGVSRTLNTTFLRAIREGTEIEVFCEVLHVGARLAAIRGEIRDCADGKLFVVGEHNKASISFEKKL